MIKSIYNAIHQAVNDNSSGKLKLKSFFGLFLGFIRYVPINRYFHYLKSIINNLEANYDIRTPSGAESTRLAESSQVIAIRDLPNMFKGDRVRGRVISFQVIVRA